MSTYSIRAFSIATICGMAAASVSAADAPLDIAMGAKVFAENCARCHEAPDPASRDGRAWRSISLHMRVFACISKEEQHQVLVFLRNQNTATMSKDAAVMTPAAASNKNALPPAVRPH